MTNRAAFLAALAWSCAVAASATAAAPHPVQIHLAYAGTGPAYRSRSVTWKTLGPTVVSEPFVEFGKAVEELSGGSKASSRTYNASVGYIHVGYIDALQQGAQRIFFRVGDRATGVWSDVSSFEMPGVDQAEKPFTALVYGDMGVRGSETTVARVNHLAQSGEVDIIAHAGDIGYAGDYSSHEFEPVWARFFDQLQPAMTRVPYMVAVGNNDRGCKNDTVCKGVLKYSYNFTNYKQLFQMPSWEKTQNMWYSYNSGPVHWVSISTETGFSDAPFGDHGGHQLEWLARDLEEANKPENRKLRPWIVVLGHRPIYSSIIIYNDFFSPIGFCRKLQEAFEDIMYKNGVDLFFNGHVHGYERNWPVYKSEVEQKSYDNPRSTVHVMAGAAGDMEGNDPWIAYSFIEPRWTGICPPPPH